MYKTLFALTALVAAGPALAQTPAPYEEGVHYQLIEQVPDDRAIDGVTVTEVFSYLCPHCGTFDPYVNKWKVELPEGVEFTRIPVEFGRPSWGLYAQAYITASVLGIEEEAHTPLMDTLYKERRQLRSMDELADFYSGFGVDKDRFLATTKSFAVDMRMKKEQQLVRQFGVTATPTMIVNGKYRIGAGGAVNSFDTMLDVVDYLVGQELAREATEKSVAEAEAEDAPPAE